MSWYMKSKSENLNIFAKDEEFGARDKWINVDSSFISKVAYYEPLEMFEIKMKNVNREYSFTGVPKEVFEAFMEADSKGTFFNKEIKNKYRLQGN